MALDVASIYQNARDAWPGLDTADLVWLAPMGSRNDALIFNRKNGCVTTGRRGQGPCFLGTLAEFERKVEEDYGQRLITPYGEIETIKKRLAEYRAAVTFLKALG